VRYWREDALPQVLLRAYKAAADDAHGPRPRPEGGAGAAAAPGGGEWGGAAGPRAALEDVRSMMLEAHAVGGEAGPAWFTGGPRTHIKPLAADSP
jgi:hypothetical protein